MRNTIVSIIMIVLIAALPLLVVLPINHPAWMESAVGGRDLEDFKLGLDLQGGTQVLLEAALAEGQILDAGAMAAAKTIVENRVNEIGRAHV